MKKFAPGWLNQIAFYWFPAIGLHAALMLLPIAPSEPPIPISETPVKVKRVARQPVDLSVAPKPVPKPAPTSAKVSLPAAPRQQTVPTLPKTAAPTAPPIAPATPARPPELVVKPSPPPSPDTLLSSNPAPTTTPSPPPSPLPPPQSTPSPQPSPDALANFSQATGATAGCSPGTESCWQVTDTQFRAVAEKLQADLTSRGYQVEPQDQEEDAGLWIARVSKGGTLQYYLHVVSANGTSFFRSPEPLSLESAKQRVGVEG